MSPLSQGKVDIGMGCRCSQSSYLQPEHEAAHLMPATLEGGFFFHTDMDEFPWLIVDLGRIRMFGEIKLWNREEAGTIVVERASPLFIEFSIDNAIWHPLARIDYLFGGRRSDSPLSLTFPLGKRGRYIRFTVEKRTHFHLDYVEIFQHTPTLAFGRAVNVLRDENSVISCEYIHQANNGLYSGYSTALHDIMTLAKSEIAVRKIDMSMSFAYFKDQTNRDAYPIFFERLGQTFLDECRGLEFHCQDVHRHYQDLPLAALKSLADLAFQPSLTIKQKARALAVDAGIDPRQTIAVVYRGTDKSTEITLASIVDYLEAAKALEKRYPNHDILIQTDQEQARSAFLEGFGKKCKFFTDLPVAGNATAIHLQLSAVSTYSRQQFCENVMAAMQVVVDCDVVLTHTGNVGAWIAIYRGGTDRLFQFDADGKFVTTSEN